MTGGMRGKLKRKNFGKNNFMKLEKETKKKNLHTRSAQRHKKRKNWLFRFLYNHPWDYTQPVGFGKPAILQAPLPGPDGKSS